jgi:hypothetical protein
LAAWTNAERPDLKQLLADGIDKTVKKHYAPPRRAKLWLVAYSDLMASIQINHLADATNRLDARPHAFDQVWLFSPFPTRKNGDALRVWPK